MIMICEECGKKYRIDPDKIKGRTAKFKCRACHHIITAVKPEAAPPESPRPITAGLDEEVKGSAPNATPVETAMQTETVMEPEKKPGRETKTISPKRKGMGLRFRMILLFFIVPMACLSVSGVLLLRQTDVMANYMMAESSETVVTMAEGNVSDIAQGVARQCALYMNSHPDLQKEDFNHDMIFKRIAVQKIGTTGYTALYQIPGIDGKWRTWAHVDPAIIGIDMESLKMTLGSNFDGFWKIYTAVRNEKKASGYYRWKEKDGRIRDKYMVCNPIPGTPYVIAATTYIDEFTQPVKEMGKRMEGQIQETRHFVFLVFGTAMVFIAIVVSIYGHRLTGRIQSLTDAANRISVGDLQMEIDVKSGDEIGELADAISRMQESIRLSIERLRLRR